MAAERANCLMTVSLPCGGQQDTKQTVEKTMTTVDAIVIEQTLDQTVKDILLLLRNMPDGWQARLGVHLAFTKIFGEPGDLESLYDQCCLAKYGWTIQTEVVNET